jgi:hypothetical protein
MVALCGNRGRAERASCRRTRPSSDTPPDTLPGGSALPPPPSARAEGVHLSSQHVDAPTRTGVHPRNESMRTFAHMFSHAPAGLSVLAGGDRHPDRAVANACAGRAVVGRVGA